MGERRRPGRSGRFKCLHTMAALGVEALLRWTPLGERVYCRAPIFAGERETRPSKAFAPEAHTDWRMQPGARSSFQSERRSLETFSAP